MNLTQLRAEWTKLGVVDPLWAVLSNPGTKGGKWNEDEFFETGRKDVEEVFASVAAAGVRVGTERVLDFGCGVGRLSQALASRFSEVVGVDISPTMLDAARSFDRSNGRCRFVLNETDDLSQFPSASFDFVYSHITLQHMEPRYALRYIREFTRLLRPDGITVFQIPVPNSAPRLTDKVKRRFPSLVRLAHELRYPGEPIIELYATPKNQIERVLREGGTAVFATATDPNGGRGSHGVIWFAKKHLQT